MLYILLFYILFLVAYVVYSAMAIYHLNRFGYVGDLTKPIIVIYLLISVVIIVLSFISIATRSWPVDLNL